MQQCENRHKRTNSGTSEEEAAPYSSGEIQFVWHKWNDRQRGQLSELRELCRRANRVVERFRGGAGADSSGEGQNQSQKHNGGPVGLVRLLRQAGRIDEREPFAFSLNF